MTSVIGTTLMSDSASSSPSWITCPAIRLRSFLTSTGAEAGEIAGLPLADYFALVGASVRRSGSLAGIAGLAVVPFTAGPLVPNRGFTEPATSMLTVDIIREGREVLQ